MSRSGGTRKNHTKREIRLPKCLHDLILNHRLTDFEARLLLLCVAVEIKPSIGPLCGTALHRLRGGESLAFPTLAVAKMCFEDEKAVSAASLLPERPLRRCQLLEINQPNDRPLLLAGLACHERSANFLRGATERDPLFLRYCQPLLQGDYPDLLRSEKDALKALEEARHKHLVLVGSAAVGQQRVAVRFAAHLFGERAETFCLPLDDFPANDGDRERLLVSIARELFLQPFLLTLDAHAGSLPPPFYLRRLLELAERTLLLAPEAPPNLPPTEVVRLQPPTAREQKNLWENALKESASARRFAPELARQFRLGVEDIRAIAHKVTPHQSSDQSRRTLWKACTEKTRPRMEGLAQRIEPRAVWEALVLPDSELRLLREIAAQVRARYAVYDEMGYAAHRSRGLGISALFHGESGTGKTLAAEVLAHDLLLDLYRIDLSAVVDKYIGETEKNLRRLFDAAEEGGGILFFDECDSLFGKRGEVKDSHDRYANLEINYLLQRMESFTGIAILATNRKNDLDKAFIRRLRFIVPFPLPEAKERAKIWAVALPYNLLDIEDPGEWPIGKSIEWQGEDGVFARLSRLNLSGGVIQNIALGAMFRAAQEMVLPRPDGKKDKRQQVNIYDIGEAAREEFQKLDRNVPESDLPPSRPSKPGIIPMKRANPQDTEGDTCE